MLGTLDGVSTDFAMLYLITLLLNLKEIDLYKKLFAKFEKIIII